MSTADRTRPSQTLVEKVTSWPGITRELGRFGSTVYRYGHREIGHVHGSSHADLPFPKATRDRLLADGQAQAHHFLPDSGWVTIPLGPEGGIDRALSAFRLNYDLVVRRKQVIETDEPG
jgi:hypothetical protein